jgi:two-component system cell cycle response regulator
MQANKLPTFLLASPQPELLTAVEPMLLAAGVRVDVVLSAEAALSAMAAIEPPDLALLDEKLPGMPIEQLLAAACAGQSRARFPVVLIADTINRNWMDSLKGGMIDDVILRSLELPYWQLRIDQTLQKHRLECELSSLRESATLDAQLDRLTGVYNREALLGLLFRETDRAQRMKSSLCLLLLDIDDFGHWNSRLGVEACDELLRQVVRRTGRLLRSYDVLGRPGKDEFLVVLPGCKIEHAVMLAERLRLEVFSAPFRVGGESIRLSACFGLALSQGRSPVVVLREAEQALVRAREVGPETIQCFGESHRPCPPPVTFLSPTSGDELLAW